MINVLLVDNQALVRAGIKKILDDVSGIKVTGEVASGEEAVKIARKSRPNVVLMELNLPGAGGLDTTRKLLRIDADIKILILTGSDNELYPTRFFQAGALGYLTKSSSIEEMIRAIRTVHAGQRFMSPDVANKLAFQHVTHKGASPFDQLSERELQVALSIIRGEAVPKIAETLCVTSKTVNSYRYRIFDKLKLKNDVEMTLLAMKHGLAQAEKHA